jgi:hypothetical protein
LSRSLFEGVSRGNRSPFQPRVHPLNFGQAGQDVGHAVLKATDRLTELAQPLSDQLKVFQG